MFFIRYYNIRKQEICEIKIKEKEIEKAQDKATEQLIRIQFQLQPKLDNEVAELIDHKQRVIKKAYKENKLWTWKDTNVENKKETARQRTVKKYLEKFEDIKIRVPKGKRQEIKEQAQRKGMSINAYVLYLIEKDKE